MADNELVRIFWTGGWDSTYRMVELSRMNVTVQPVYCLDSHRSSSRVELERMEKILHLLAEKKERKAVFLPIEKIDVSQLFVKNKLKEAWKEISQQIHLGTQYMYLAQVAKQFPGIELGLEKPNGEFSGATSTLYKFGRLVPSPHGLYWTRNRQLPVVMPYLAICPFLFYI